MKLYEYEGKLLFMRAGIPIPQGGVVEKGEDIGIVPMPCVVKAQVLCGGRGKAGGVRMAQSSDEAAALAREIESISINGEAVSCVMVEEQLDSEREYYACVAYDTNQRAPVLLVSKSGGVDVEEKKDVTKKTLDPVKDPSEDELADFLVQANIPPQDIPGFVDVIQRMLTVFFGADARQVEINPLIKTKDGQFVAADAKIVLDDDALYRHPEIHFPQRSPSGRELTVYEQEAKKIDEGDHRGTAGGSFYDLDGDIAVLASGGGASLACVDALMGYGGKPANYVEYSGNPPRDKVRRLAKITLSKPDLRGCWVVGGTANFTDIFETLGGFMDALDELSTEGKKPGYPIVIRRAGPRDKEAFEMVKERAAAQGYDITLFTNDTPMTTTAKVLLDKVNAR